MDAVSVSEERGSSRCRAPSSTVLCLYHRACQLATPGFIKAVARVCIASFFLNLAYEDYETYAFMRTDHVREMVQKYPGQFPGAAFPYWKLLVLVPAAIMVALGIQVPAAGGALLMYMVKDSALLVWSQMNNLMRYGQKPNELMLKRLAVFGCVVLLLAHYVRGLNNLKVKVNSYAGLLMQSLVDKQQAGLLKSLVLLFGRLKVSLLFLFVGYQQVDRVLARDLTLWNYDNRMHWTYRDGHDNNWLLLELLLCVPFAVGFKTEVMSRLLCGTLMMEAVQCWPFWAHHWPNWHYVGHVRLHFFTNLAVSGGLLLLQGLGAGRFTVDNLLLKKKQ